MSEILRILRQGGPHIPGARAAKSRSPLGTGRGLGTTRETLLYPGSHSGLTGLKQNSEPDLAALEGTSKTLKTLKNNQTATSEERARSGVLWSVS